jgi:hypothetical protein
MDPFTAPEISRDRAEQLLESFATHRYGAEIVSDNDRLAFDARSITGEPLELKACALRVRDGSSRRRGRWYIREWSHNELLAERGRYLLGVYDHTPEIVAVASIPAARIEELLSASEWFDCYSSENGGLATQLTYTRVFPSLDARLSTSLEPVSSSSSDRAVSDGGARR